MKHHDHGNFEIEGRGSTSQLARCTRPKAQRLMIELLGPRGHGAADKAGHDLARGVRQPETGRLLAAYLQCHLSLKRAGLCEADGRLASNGESKASVA